MVKTALVSFDVDRGAKIIEGLEAHGLKIRVALWLYLSDYEDWRLGLSSPKFAGLGTMACYGLLNATLDAAGFEVEQVPSILVLPPAGPFVRDLRRVFGKARNVEGMRLGGQIFGGQFVEDAFVYRIS
jgi:hypothetical protein